MTNKLTARESFDAWWPTLNAPEAHKDTAWAAFGIVWAANEQEIERLQRENALAGQSIAYMTKKVEALQKAAADHEPRAEAAPAPPVCTCTPPSSGGDGNYCWIRSGMKDPNCPIHWRESIIQNGWPHDTSK